MAKLFKRIAGAAKKVGARLFSRLGTTPTSPDASEAVRLRREEEVLRQRQVRAEREAEATARLIKQLSASGRKASSGRAAEVEAERIRRQVMDLARKERQARETAERTKREADDVRQRALASEGMRSLQEQTQTSGREVQAQQRGVRHLSQKAYGRGGLPGWQEFMIGEPFSRFSSSNVDTLQYDAQHQHLYIRYVNGRWYRYHDISRAMAYEGYISYSKGIFVWDRIRVRGKGNAKKTQKRFDRDAPPPSDLPLTGSARDFVLSGGGL